MFTTLNSSTVEPITADSSAIVIPLSTKPTTPNATKSFEAFKESWQLQIAADKSLPAGALRVALAISAHMNRQQSGLAWPGYGRLEKILGIDRSTVIRNVRRLEKAGYLSVKRRRNGSKNAPNEYRPRLKGSGTAMPPPPHPPSGTDATTLVAQLRHPPSGIAVPPEPLNEPPNEPLIKKEREPRPSASATLNNPNPITEAKLVAEESKTGTNVTSSANPSSPNSLMVWNGGGELSASSEPGALRQACFGWAREFAPNKVKMVQRMLDDGYAPIQVYEAIKYYGADFVNYLWANPKERRRMDHDNPVVSAEKSAEWLERLNRCWGTLEERRREHQEIDEKIRRYHEKERSK